MGGYSVVITNLYGSAELKLDEPVTKAAIMVEYSSVEIAGKTYICPVKSVSSAVGQSIQFDPLYKFPLANQLQPLKHSLSAARFDQYHVFRAEARVVNGEGGDTGNGLPTLSAANAQDTANPGKQAEEATAAGTTATAPNLPASEALPATTQPAEIAKAAAPIPSPEPAVPEITVGDANNVPDIPANARPVASDSGFTLHTTARLVDVGVVAFDKKGHPVTDLKPEDFELYDNGRKQEVRFFSQAGTEAALPPVSRDCCRADAQSTSSPGDFSNRRASNVDFRGAVQQSNITVLLIDSGNIAWGDLSYARSEMMRFLKDLPADEQVGNLHHEVL